MSKKIEVGDILEGKVVKIKPFGAIVSLPDNSHGLVHISQVSAGFVQNVNDHLSVDDTVKVKVLSIDEANKKISLSIKDATTQPPQPQKTSSSQISPEIKGTFEEKFKEWLKDANDRQAGLNKRSKRR